MAKTKNKNISKAQVEAERAQQKKQFLSKMKYYCNLYGGEGTFELIPQSELEYHYKNRCYAEKIQIAEGTLGTQKSLIQFKQFLKKVFEEQRIDSEHPEIKFSVRDYISVGITIIATVRHIEGKQTSEWGKEFCKRLAMLNDDASFEKAITFIHNLLTHTGFLFCDSRQKMQWFSYDYFLPNPKGGIDFIIQLHAKGVETKRIQTENGKHSAIRLSWAVSYHLNIEDTLQDLKDTNPELILGFHEFSLKPSLLGNKQNNADLPVPVYIQMHALDRIEERLDCISRVVLHNWLFHIMLNVEVLITGENKGLIPFNIFDHKLGYFVCEYIDNVILLRTFLFLTNNGTPEGRKLYELTGLKKLDKQYLAIDKLSSFAKSDISTNENTRELLINAGCESLLDLDKKIITINDQTDFPSIASLIEQYLKKDDVDDLLFEDETE